MAVANRHCDAVIHSVSSRLETAFGRFVGIYKELPAAPYGITKSEQMYHLLQEAARDNTHPGNNKRADEILGVLEDITAHTVKSMDTVIATHGEPGVLTVGEIFSTATAVRPLAAETAQARTGTPAPFDWHATICLISSAKRFQHDLDNREAYLACKRALNRIRVMVVHRFRQFAGGTDLLISGDCGVFSEQAYGALQAMALQSGDALTRLAIHHVLYDIDQATLREENELIMKLRVPETLLAHFTRVSATRVPVTAPAAPRRGEGPPGVDARRLNGASSPPEWSAEGFDSFDEFRKLLIQRSTFVSREDDDAVRDSRRATRRIYGRVKRAFDKFGGKDEHLQQADQSMPPAEMMYVILRDMAEDSASSNNKRRALNIRDALVKVKRHAVVSLDKLTETYGVADIQTSGGVPSPTMAPSTPATETTPSPAGATAPHPGLPSAIESARSPHTTTSSNAHVGSADPRRLNRVEAPLPGRAELQVDSRVPDTPPAETDGLFEVADAASWPVPPIPPIPPIPPVPSTVEQRTVTARVPALSHVASPGWQPEGTLGFAGSAAGSGELPLSRRTEIVRRFTPDAAQFEVDVAYDEGRFRTLGWSDTRWYRLRGDLLQLQATAQVKPGTAESIETLDWHGLQELMEILDAPADLS